MGKIVVDNIDRSAGVACIEIGEHFVSLPISLLPHNIHEGAVLKLVIDEDASKTREEIIKELENSLFED